MMNTADEATHILVTMAFPGNIIPVVSRDEVIRKGRKRLVSDLVSSFGRVIDERGLTVHDPVKTIVRLEWARSCLRGDELCPIEEWEIR